MFEAKTMQKRDQPRAAFVADANFRRDPGADPTRRKPRRRSIPHNKIGLRTTRTRRHNGPYPRPETAPAPPAHSSRRPQGEPERWTASQPICHKAGTRFATLGRAVFVYGFVRCALAPLYVVYMPASADADPVFRADCVAGLPASALHQGGQLHLRHRRQFRRRAQFRRAGARRQVLHYALCGAIACVAGLITAMSAFRRLILLASIVLERLVNPRDKQTEQ
jgi:hypothetical protein